MFSSARLLRAIAIIYLGAAIGVMNYWWQFHQGELFPVVALSQIEPNIYQYYLIEKSVFKAEMVLSVCLLVNSLLLCGLILGRTGLSHLTEKLSMFNAGACVFLSGVSLSLGLGTGLYRIKHYYADTAFEADLWLLVVGLICAFASYCYGRSRRHECRNDRVELRHQP